MSAEEDTVEPKEENKEDKPAEDDKAAPEAEDESVEQEVSTAGINLAWLLDYASKINSDWTTTDVCVNLVMPETKKKKSAWIDLHGDLKTKKGNLVVGKAQYFCSHAWRYKFKNCIDALRMFAEQKGLEPEETYIWFDLFINNQHAAAELPHSWWCTRFKEAIRSFGRTVLVLEPWTDPIPITRAWCLWEIYCTIDTESEFHVAMCEAQHEDFKSKLTKQFEDIRTNISSIDARRADAWNKHDRDMIFKAIENTVGFVKLNDRVMQKMRYWLQTTGEGHLEETKKERGEEDIETLETIDCLGKLYRDQDRLEDAAKLFAQAVEGFSKTTGEASSHTCQAMNDLAFVLQSMGKDEEAIEMHKRCLKARVKLFGELHKDTTQTMSNMAAALRKLGKLSDAKKMFKQAIDCRDKTDKLGPGHPATLYTVTTYAACLTEAKDFTDAEKAHKRAVNGLQKFFGKFMPDGRKHPLTLMAIHNLGEHLHRIGKNTEAMDVLLEAYQGRIEKLGENNKSTLETKKMMEAVTDAMRAAGERIRIQSFHAETVEVYRKERLERRRLWQKAASFLAFQAKLRQNSNYSETDFAAT